MCLIYFFLIKKKKVQMSGFKSEQPCCMRLAVGLSGAPWRPRGPRLGDFLSGSSGGGFQRDPSTPPLDLRSRSR